jgi:hypothetical protein
VSLVASAIKSTDLFWDIFAISIPIRMSTPFCSNLGSKSASLKRASGLMRNVEEVPAKV